MSDALRINLPSLRGTVRVLPLARIYCPPTKVSPALVRSIQHRGLRSLIVTREPMWPERAEWQAQGIPAEQFDVVVDAGRRRFNALRQLGHEQVAVLVVDADCAAEDTTLMENLTRSRNLVSELEAYERLRQAGRTDEDVMRELGIYKRDLNRLIRLLRMAPITRSFLEAGEISPSAAAEIAKVPEAEQRRFFETAGKFTLQSAKEWVWQYRLNPSQLDFLNVELPLE